MSRRHVKEFRPEEALGLISADRAGQVLQCPCCGAGAVRRTPRRLSNQATAAGPVTLTCGTCGRVVTYIDRESGPSQSQG